jgi:hypothetical protein
MSLSEKKAISAPEKNPESAIRTIKTAASNNMNT